MTHLWDHLAQAISRSRWGNHVLTRALLPSTPNHPGKVTFKRALLLTLLCAHVLRLLLVASRHQKHNQRRPCTVPLSRITSRSLHPTRQMRDETCRLRLLPLLARRRYLPRYQSMEPTQAPGMVQSIHSLPSRVAPTFPSLHIRLRHISAHSFPQRSRASRTDSTIRPAKKRHTLVVQPKSIQYQADDNRQFGAVNNRRMSLSPPSYNPAVHSMW